MADLLTDQALNELELSDREFIRYSRQVMLEQWNEQGQLTLKKAKVVIIGCGGLGNIAASFLAGAGVGQLVLVDDDCVELSNLPRQLAFEEGDIENAKALALANRLREQNEHIEVVAQTQRFDADDAHHLFNQADLVLDCTDNFATRYALNHSCVAHAIPLLSASVIGWQGQLLLVDPNQMDYGCYQCLFDSAQDSAANCTTSGVSGAAVGIIASYQANEAIRYLLGQQSSLASSLLLIDSQSLHNQILKRVYDENCSICNAPRQKENVNVD